MTMHYEEEEQQHRRGRYGVDIEGAGPGAADPAGSVFEEVDENETTASYGEGGAMAAGSSPTDGLLDEAAEASDTGGL